MLPGYAGHLLAESFLEALVAREDDPEELDRARRELIAWRRRLDLFGPASSLRAMLHAGATPLVTVLGFEAPSAIEPAEHAVSATVSGQGGAIALIVVSWGERLDPLWRLAIRQAIQRSAPWALLFNGARLRILDVRRLFARRYAEFDFDAALDARPTLAALWRVARASTLTGEGRVTPLDALVLASDRHASAVCRSLRDGVLAASTDVLGALVRGGRANAESMVVRALEQALTIVYRILFLLFAEARSLVPVWHPVYRESYSIESLRVLAEGPERECGLWEALRAIARMAHAGCEAGDLRVTPFNGRLFAPAGTPLAERHDLSDDSARSAVLALATRQAAGGIGRERIAYGDLGVEQVGAVYETLLDYAPRVRRRAARPGFRPKVDVTLERGSGLRKSTGSFYTPQPIAAYLVRQTLEPLVRGASPESILQLRIVDPAMGSGAFLVAACRYLAGVYEAALVQRGSCHPSDIDEPERALIRRTIAERCLYGVDLNPMAVQLARLSLWLTTLAAERPLGFLDHRLQVGDSLLGAWLANLDRPPGTRRQRGPESTTLPLFDEAAFRETMLDVLPARFSLESIPNDTLDQVRSKERTLAAICARNRALWKWKRIADLWCGSWFAGRAADIPTAAFTSLSDEIRTGRCTLPARTIARYLEAGDEIARARRFFHWELEFPEVFFGADGRRREQAGFDAVIGNPPWDMIRADHGAAEARTLARTDFKLLVRFIREAGVYEARSDGHPNRYQLFLERAIALTRPGGRIGLVLPAGFAIDHGSAALRKTLFARCDVDALVGVDNRRGVFPVHRSLGFLLLTALRGAPTDAVACRFGLDDPAELDTSGDEPRGNATRYPVRLSISLLRQLSGDSLTIPLFRSPVDVAIAERASALFPPLGAASGWAVRFGRELNATDDRPWFQAPRHGLPVVEGKQIVPFHVNLDSARHSVASRDLWRLLPDGRHTRPRLAYRDVASRTNRVTLIAAVLPAGCVSTHTVFCLRTALTPAGQHFLCGLFNSFVVNFLVRSRITSHVTTATIERLPIPTAYWSPAAYLDISALARLLARTRRAHVEACLQARVARLYQLSTAEFEHVLSTFPLVPEDQRRAALKIFATETAG